jgi:hypothetical protein
MSRKHDHNRKAFNQIMIESGITHGSIRYEQLRNFLDDPVNSPYLQMYYLLCAGYLDINEIRNKTNDLVSEMDFIYNGHYSYRKLFSIDFGWYEYFKENAWPTGQRRTSRGDYRRGVDCEDVDVIMRIKKGPPTTDLETAIILQCQLKHAHHDKKTV